SPVPFPREARQRRDRPRGRSRRPGVPQPANAPAPIPDALPNDPGLRLRAEPTLAARGTGGCRPRDSRARSPPSPGELSGPAGPGPKTMDPDPGSLPPPRPAGERGRLFPPHPAMARRARPARGGLRPHRGPGGRAQDAARNDVARADPARKEPARKETGPPRSPRQGPVRRLLQSPAGRSVQPDDGEPRGVPGNSRRASARAESSDPLGRGTIRHRDDP